MSDHVHMLVMIPPKLSVSSFMGYLKGKSALMIFDRHANLKYKYGNRHFWSEGYYVSTVGLNDQTVAKYIREQEGHDIAMDKLSVKEYQNPFEDKEMKRKQKREEDSKRRRKYNPFKGWRESKAIAQTKRKQRLQRREQASIGL